MSEHLISREAAESDLLACAAYLAESINSSDGQAEAMTAVVPRYLAKDEVDLAAELANTVDDPFTRDRLLIIVAEKCAETDDDEYAGQLLESIEDFGLQAEGRERMGLIKAGKGQFDAARTIAVDVPHPDYVYSAIAVKQFADGDREAFRTTLSEVEFPAARVSAYMSVAHSQINTDDAGDVAELLEKAVIDAAEIEHDEEKIRAIVETGNLFIDARLNGKAIETFDKAREYAEDLDNIHRDAFLAAVSVGFLRAGSQDLSDRALDLVGDKTQIATCLVGHARHYWANDRKDEALESLEEAYVILRSQRDIETRNAKERYRLFTTIAAQFAAFEKGERAIEIAERIEDDEQSMAALGQIATILTARGETELSRRAVNAIPEDAQRTFALIGVSDALAKRSENTEAIAMLDEAVELAETVPQLASRAYAYNEIAKRFAKFEEADRFDSSIEKCIEAVSTVKDESIKVTSLVELAELVDELALDIPPEDLDFLKTMLRDVPRN